MTAWRQGLARFAKQSVRRADIRDLEVITRLLVEYGCENYGIPASPENLLGYRRAAAEYLSGDKHAVYLLEAARGMVTVTLVEHPYLPSSAYVDNLYIRPMSRSIQAVCSLIHRALTDAADTGLAQAVGEFSKGEKAFYGRYARQIAVYELRLQDG